MKREAAHGHVCNNHNGPLPLHPLFLPSPCSSPPLAPLSSITGIAPTACGALTSVCPRNLPPSQGKRRSAQRAQQLAVRRVSVCWGWGGDLSNHHLMLSLPRHLGNVQLLMNTADGAAVKANSRTVNCSRPTAEQHAHSFESCTGRL